MAEAKKASKKQQTQEAEMVVEAAPAKKEEQPQEVAVAEKATAKAGKRSAKALRDTEEKQAKEERKKLAESADKAAPKPAQKPPRSKAERAGKRYREAAGLIDRAKIYTIAEAMDLAVKTANAKFDQSVEMHINLNVDPRQADQNVRDTVVLPAGTGKTVRIAVLAEGDDAAKAKKAGADIAAVDEIFALLDKEEISFDVLIATPALMPRLGKYARMLGPRGLMPNPKSGTVSANPATAVEEAKAGRVEYRVDQSGIVHLGIGKASFGADKLSQNAEAVLSSIRAAKPSSIKGAYIKSIYVTTTMGPGIKVQP